MHRLMAAMLAGAPVVIHDFHCPAAVQQVERDRAFWSAARWAITGPESARPPPLPAAHGTAA